MNLFDPTILERAKATVDDWLYVVFNGQDYRMQLDKLRDLFNIGDVEEWQTVTYAQNTTNNFINTVDSSVYGQVEIEYLIKRGTRHYRAGRAALVYDQTGPGVSAGYIEAASDPAYDDLGVDFTGIISAGVMQLQVQVDASDANDVVLNYKIVSKKPITVA